MRIFRPAAVALMASSILASSAGAAIYQGQITETLTEKSGTSTSTTTTQKATSVSQTSRGIVLTDAKGAAYTLAPKEYSASQSNSTYAVYNDTSSGAAFSLLRQSASNPLIALTYVTYAKWSRPVAPSSGADSSVLEDMVVYGRQTALRSMPKTGTATYSAILDGRYAARYGALSRLSGNAGVTANFATGTLGMFINPVATDVASGASTRLGSLSGSGSITGGAFSGSDSSADYSFSYAGNFYGTTAQEVGGTFSFFLPAVFGSGSGVFVGAKGALPAQDAEYTPPPPPPPPPPPADMVPAYQVEQVRSNTGLHANTWMGGSSISYDSASDTYVIHELDGPARYSLTPAEIVAAESNNRFTVYLDAETGVTVRSLNKGAGNDLIALTYVSYAGWSRGVDDGGVPSTKFDYVVFGQRTDSASMPLTGGASYAAKIDGSMTGIDGSNYALGGDASFQADFGAGKLGYDLRPVASSGSSSVELGSFTGSSVISGSSFYTPIVAGGANSSSVTGGFYGPGAAEIGGVFRISTGYDAPITGAGSGAFVGKK